METGQPGRISQELLKAEVALEEALTDACALKPSVKSDTGELIKVEEVLQLAGDAAKRAISLRRKRRSDRGQRAARWAMGDAEAAASMGAMHRTFADARSVWWDVFAVYPETRSAAHTPLRGTFQQGWLCFDSGSEKRRLSPIPDDWQRSSDSELEGLLGRAEVASTKRKGGPKKEAQADDTRKDDERLS